MGYKNPDRVKTIWWGIKTEIWDIKLETGTQKPNDILDFEDLAQGGGNEPRTTFLVELGG